MINNIFFGLAPALSAIFQLGFEPTEECFYELTSEQYEKLKEEGEDIDLGDENKMEFKIVDSPHELKRIIEDKNKLKKKTEKNEPKNLS